MKSEVEQTKELLTSSLKNMKKLGKLSINPEKVIRNEELVNLKGGEYGGCCICENGRAMYGPTNSSECASDCDGAGFGGYTWSC